MGDELNTEFRTLNIQSRTKVPSRGFITPTQRGRYEFIQDMCDRTTAMKMYALIHEVGTHSNIPHVIESAIIELYRDKAAEMDGRWRYYCSDCEFIGAAYKTHTEAEAGATAHSEVCSGMESVKVFRYGEGYWDPENVEELASRGEVEFR